MRFALIITTALIGLSGCMTTGQAADATAGSTFDFIADGRMIFGSFVESRFSPSEVEAIVSQLCPEQAVSSFASELTDTTTATFRAVCSADVQPRFEGYTVTRAGDLSLMMSRTWERNT